MVSMIRLLGLALCGLGLLLWLIAVGFFAGVIVAESTGVLTGDTSTWGMASTLGLVVGLPAGLVLLLAGLAIIFR